MATKTVPVSRTRYHRATRSAAGMPTSASAPDLIRLQAYLRSGSRDRYTLCSRLCPVTHASAPALAPGE